MLAQGFHRHHVRPLIAAVALSLGAASETASARSAHKAIWGPFRVEGVSQFPIYRDLGVDIYETGLNWANVAKARPLNPRDPSDPAYVWPAYMDYVVSEARSYGIRVAVNLTRAPAWANGGKAREWAPRRPQDFANFAAAASRRYPSIRYWLVWSEASRQANFQPMPKGSARGPRLYARILDATYGRLKRVNRRNVVIGGNTFTTGDVPALSFARHMRLANGKRPRLDLYGHNPFTKRRPRLADPPLGHGFVDFGGLDDLARRLDRYYGRRVRLFLSEFTVPTGHMSAAFDFYVSEDTAASWLTSAFRIAHRWNRVHALGWYKLYDDPPSPNDDEGRWGLIAADGRKKPAYFAYQRA
jgi:hypothetical protein